MKSILGILCALAAVSPVRAEQPQSKPAAPKSYEVAVGETIAISLDCNPTTGYEWRLKSVNPKVARLEGEIEFNKGPSEPGMVGAGGTCTATFKGVKPGKTTAVLEYRRAWEKGKAGETFKAALRVVAKKAK